MLTKVRQWRAVRVLVRRLGVHRVSSVVGAVQAPFLLLLAPVLRRLPRDARLVALGSPLDRFADNAAYLYLHLAEQASGLEPDRHGALRPVWVSGSAEVVRRLRAQGYPAVTRWSARGVVTAVRAGTFVYSAYRSDVNRWLAPGAVTVGLWHGLPIKRVEGAVGGHEDADSGLLRRLQQAAREPAPDYLLTPSDFVAERFAPAFGVPRDRCWHLGYPRNDHLLVDPAKPPAALSEDQESWSRLERSPLVVGLFLTWRDDRVDDVVDADLLAELAALCLRSGGLLAYKAHYNVASAEVPDQGCVALPTDADLHAYLGLCDVLVTDYSSVALDFLLMRRPVVYFMPDLEHYEATRGFHVDPLALPGVVTRDQRSLLEALERVLQDPTTSTSWTDDDTAFMTRLWGPNPAGASAGIAAALATVVNGGRVSVRRSASAPRPEG